MKNPGTKTPNLHALLIGVDCYMPNKLPGGCYYPSLGGCVRDIRHVESFLQSRLGVKPERILKLTASLGGGKKPSEPPAQWPTYENMVASFKRLIEAAKAGDQVYIHYSGHGGRTQTAFADLKGKGELDEALVPTDIGNSEARYLRDIELAYLLQAMVEKKLVVTLVLDSCHSGGATRGIGKATPRTMVRSEFVYDTTVRPTDSAVASMSELAAVWRKIAGSTRAAKPAGGWLAEPRDYTLLAACRANESAYEDCFSGSEKNGALTYWLLDSLRCARPGISYKMLHDRILAKIRSWMVEQTPQLQGDGDRSVFGTERITPHYAIPVMKVDKAGARLSLNAGEAHGLAEGTLLAVYPPGAADLQSKAGRQALAVVTELIGDADSRAEVSERFGQKPIEAGAQAVVLGSTDRRLQRAAGLALKDSALRKALEAAIQEHGAGFIRLAGANETLDFQVALDETGKIIEIWDRKGSALPNLRPEVKAADPGAAERIAKRLVHLAKFFNVQALTGPESDLSQKLAVELVGAAAEGAEGGTPVYAPGTIVTLKLTNKLTPNPKDINDPTRILNITVLDLQSDWGITQVFPSSAGAFDILQPGKSRELKFKTLLPEGYSETTDVLKVFATQRTTNFRWLELPALDKAPKAVRSARGRITDPLEQLMSAINGDQAPSPEEVRTRSVALLAEPGEEKTWTVAQVEMCVKKA
jgi:hypothetical protein